MNRSRGGWKGRSPTKSVLCVLSEEQAQEFEANCLGQQDYEGVRVTFEPNPEDGLDLVGLQKPDLMVVGMTIGETEGLEFLAMLMARYPELSAKVVLLPEAGDPFSPMIHYRDQTSGRSVGQESDLAEVAALIRELAVKRPATAQPQAEHEVAEGPPPRTPQRSGDSSASPSATLATARAGSTPDIPRRSGREKQKQPGRLKPPAVRPRRPPLAPPPMPPAAQSAETTAKRGPARVRGVAESPELSPPIQGEAPHPTAPGEAPSPARSVSDHAAADLGSEWVPPQLTAQSPANSAPAQQLADSPTSRGTETAPEVVLSADAAPPVARPDAVERAPQAHGDNRIAATQQAPTSEPDPTPVAHRATVEERATSGSDAGTGTSFRRAWWAAAGVCGVLALAALGVTATRWFADPEGAPTAAASAASAEGRRPLAGTPGRPALARPPQAGRVEARSQASAPTPSAAPSERAMAPAPADAATIDVGQLTTLPLAWAKGAVDYRVTDKERLHAIVRALSRALDADPAATVQVGGHASSRYAEKRNLHLGLLRARRLRFWLSKRGIPAARMKLANLGSSHPVTTDPGQERRNRRVTVQVLVAPSE